MGSYGISITTLEQVFIRLAKEAELNSQREGEGEGGEEGDGWAGGQLSWLTTKKQWMQQQYGVALRWLWSPLVWVCGTALHPTIPAPFPSSSSSSSSSTRAGYPRTTQTHSTAAIGALQFSSLSSHDEEQLGELGYVGKVGGNVGDADTMGLPQQQQQQQQQQQTVFFGVGLDVEAVELEQSSLSSLPSWPKKGRGAVTEAKNEGLELSSSLSSLNRGVVTEVKNEAKNEGDDNDKEEEEGEEKEGGGTWALVSEAGGQEKQQTTTTVSDTFAAPLLSSSLSPSLSSLSCCKDSGSGGWPLVKIQLIELLRKRFIVAKRDLKGFCFQVKFTTDNYYYTIIIISIIYSTLHSLI